MTPASSTLQSARNTPTQQTTIHPIKLGFSNAYLVQGEQNVLVDTGSPGESKKILEALRRHGVVPTDLALILHTHVHSDHVGSTAELLKYTSVPTAYHAADEPLMQQGNNGKLTGIGLRGKVMATFFSGSKFERFTPSVHLTDKMRLDDYGIAATVLHTPGHTPGSVSLLFDNGEAIVGDVWMGGFVGGNILSKRPNYHYFAEDEVQLKQSMSGLLAEDVTTLYVGHGGPLDASRVRRRFGY